MGLIDTLSIQLALRNTGLAWETGLGSGSIDDPQVSTGLLMENGTDFIVMEDGVSIILLEG